MCAIDRLKDLDIRTDRTWLGGWIRFDDPISLQSTGLQLPARCMWLGTDVPITKSMDRWFDWEERSAEEALSVLADAVMQMPQPHLPGRLEVSHEELVAPLSQALGPMGVEVVRTEDAANIEEGLAELLKDIFEKVKGVRSEAELEDMLEGLDVNEDWSDDEDYGDFDDGSYYQPWNSAGDVTEDHMRSFAEAAASFVESGMHRVLSDEDLIEIESAAPGPEFRFAGILPYNDVEFGFEFHPSEDDYLDLMDAASPEDMIDAIAGHWTLQFTRDTDMFPDEDLDLWEDASLPRPGDLVPVLVNRTRWERPNKRILAFVEGLLRALTHTHEAELDLGRWTKRVFTVDGVKEFTLSLPYVLTGKTHAQLGLTQQIDPRSTERTLARLNRHAAREGIKTPAQAEAIARRLAENPEEMDNVPPETDRDRAQEMCYDAFDMMGRGRNIRARKALEVYPDCADAYNILAENAPSKKEEAALYRKALEAARRDLGEAFFEEHRGKFWGILETRPYMRALRGVAAYEATVGNNPGKAIELYRQAVELDASDTAGARYWLVPLLIEADCDDEVRKLIDRFAEDDTPMMTYCNALLAFRDGGDTPTARAALKQAMKGNPWVPKLLVYPTTTSFSVDDPDPAKADAATDAPLLSQAWKSTPKALSWLRQQMKSTKPGKKGRSRRRR